MVTYDTIITNGRWFDATVSAVFVGGRAVFLHGESTDVVGAARTGRFPRAEHKAPAQAIEESELSSVS